VIGRGESCELAIVDEDLSREHARVHRDWTGATIADLGSKNGTWVGSTRLATGAERRLRDGDEIRLGQTRLIYRDPAEQFLAEMESTPAPPAPEPEPAPAPVTPIPAKRRNLAPMVVALLLILLSVAALVWLLNA
jgi:pSer/pThr/pTyr-binding forkhead associated (FHA) protein